MAFTTEMLVGEKVPVVRVVKLALVAKRLVEVAAVVVERTTERLVMVEVPAEVRIPPERVERPVTVSDESVPTLVSDEASTDAPKVVAFKTWALLIEKAPPVARLRLPEERERPPAKVEEAVEVAENVPAIKFPTELEPT